MELETGLTGPDWEPTDATRYYAQKGKAFAFGPTEADALASLITLGVVDKGCILFNCCTDNAEPDWSQFDWLEIGGCVDEDGCTHGGLDRYEAQFFSIYGHYAASSGEVGLECITDVKTLPGAEAVAAYLEGLSGLPTTITC